MIIKLNYKQKIYFIEFKKTLMLFGPLLAALLSQKGMSLVDALFMGSLGPESLAASSLAHSLYSFFATVGLGILSSVGVLVARAYGEKNSLKAGIVFYSSVCITAVFCVLTIIILWFAPTFLVSFGQEPRVVGKTIEYMHTVIWGLPALMAFFALLEFSSSLEHPRIAMVFSFISIPLVAIANNIFVYGRLGLPKMGIVGIGLSTALVQWMICIGFYLYVLWHKDLREYIKFSAKTFFSKDAAREIIKIGLPAGFINLLETGMMFAAALMMGRFGTTTLAAHQIIIVSTTILCRFPMAFGITSAIRVSQKVGMKRYKSVRATLKANLLLGSVMGIILGIVFATFSVQIVNLFISQSEASYGEVLRLSKIYIYIGAVIQLVDYLVSIINGSLRGMKDTFVPMWICLVLYWVVGIGGGYVLAFIFHLEGLGVWIGQLLGLASTCLVLYIRFNKVYGRMLADAFGSKYTLQKQKTTNSKPQVS
ncbi:MATE family efflux transporter [Marinisporobacter balticus]|uniref:Probable multidrug resistance protein NorM n=1 Tax=Marinisporobacter balticus TaxID=2018667 RepID=A0A4R2KAE2_9FIRM|nr:MATE family efflux transporter [Marinisporobacter balticus]TCO70413.1 MATE family multidrug resistance protein [Marinisporobacter balticus]